MNRICRVIWAVVGLILLVVGLLLTGIWGIVGIVLGAVLVLVALVGWCPVCRLSGKEGGCCSPQTPQT